MKKVLLIVALFIATCSYSFSQEIGVRFGNVTAGHAALDVLFNTGKFSNIHADVSFGNGAGIDLLWDFLYKPLGGEALNLYIGAGPYAWIDDPFWLGATAEIGLEYRFNSAPFVIGVDYRPRLSIIESTDVHWEGFGLNIRYVFGKK